MEQRVTTDTIVACNMAIGPAQQARLPPFVLLDKQYSPQYSNMTEKKHLVALCTQLSVERLLLLKPMQRIRNIYFT
jgi:hypothetical protein